MIIGNHACVLCGYPYIFACSEEGGGYRPCEVCALRAERDQLRNHVEALRAVSDDCSKHRDEVLASYRASVKERDQLRALCDEHAEATREQYRKEMSKGCGPRPEVEPHEQDTAVEIAVGALGLRPAQAQHDEEKKP